MKKQFQQLRNIQTKSQNYLQFNITDFLRDSVGAQSWKNRYGLWNIISGFADQYSRDVYDKIKSVVNNTADIDYCNIKALKSIAQSAGLQSYTDFIQLNYPKHIIQLIDLFSINPQYILHDGKSVSKYATTDIYGTIDQRNKQIFQTQCFSKHLLYKVLDNLDTIRYLLQTVNGINFYFSIYTVLGIKYRDIDFYSIQSVIDGEEDMRPITDLSLDRVFKQLYIIKDQYNKHFNSNPLIDIEKYQNTSKDVLTQVFISRNISQNDMNQQVDDFFHKYRFDYSVSGNYSNYFKHEIILNKDKILQNCSYIYTYKDIYDKVMPQSQLEGISDYQKQLLKEDIFIGWNPYVSEIKNTDSTYVFENEFNMDNRKFFINPFMVLILLFKKYMINQEGTPLILKYTDSQTNTCHDMSWLFLKFFQSIQNNRNTYYKQMVAYHFYGLFYDTLINNILKDQWRIINKNYNGILKQQPVFIGKHKEYQQNQFKNNIPYYVNKTDLVQFFSSGITAYNQYQLDFISYLAIINNNCENTTKFEYSIPLYNNDYDIMLQNEYTVQKRRLLGFSVIDQQYRGTSDKTKQLIYVDMNKSYLYTVSLKFAQLCQRIYHIRQKIKTVVQHYSQIGTSNIFCSMFKQYFCSQLKNKDDNIFLNSVSGMPSVKIVQYMDSTDYFDIYNRHQYYETLQYPVQYDVLQQSQNSFPMYVTKKINRDVLSSQTGMYFMDDGLSTDFDKIIKFNGISQYIPEMALISTVIGIQKNNIFTPVYYSCSLYYTQGYSQQLSSDWVLASFPVITGYCEYLDEYNDEQDIEFQSRIKYDIIKPQNIKLSALYPVDSDEFITLTNGIQNPYDSLLSMYIKKQDTNIVHAGFTACYYKNIQTDYTQVNSYTSSIVLTSYIQDYNGIHQKYWEIQNNKSLYQQKFIKQVSYWERYFPELSNAKYQQTKINIYKNKIYPVLSSILQLYSSIPRTQQKLFERYSSSGRYPLENMMNGVFPSIASFNNISNLITVEQYDTVKEINRLFLPIFLNETDCTENIVNRQRNYVQIPQDQESFFGIPGSSWYQYYVSFTGYNSSYGHNSNTSQYFGNSKLSNTDGPWQYTALSQLLLTRQKSLLNRYPRIKIADKREYIPVSGFSVPLSSCMYNSNNTYSYTLSGYSQEYNLTYINGKDDTYRPGYVIFSGELDIKDKKLYFESNARYDYQNDIHNMKDIYSFIEYEDAVKYINKYFQFFSDEKKNALIYRIMIYNNYIYKKQYYNIDQYKQDAYGNAVTLFKHFQHSEYEDAGEIWIRLKDHILSFPMMMYRDIDQYQEYDYDNTDIIKCRKYNTYASMLKQLCNNALKFNIMNNCIWILGYTYYIKTQDSFKKSDRLHLMLAVFQYNPFTDMDYTVDLNSLRIVNIYQDNSYLNDINEFVGAYNDYSSNSISFILYDQNKLNNYLNTKYNIYKNKLNSQSLNDELVQRLHINSLDIPLKRYSYSISDFSLIQQQDIMFSSIKYPTAGLFASKQLINHPGYVYKEQLNTRQTADAADSNLKPGYILQDFIGYTLLYNSQTGQNSAVIKMNIENYYIQCFFNQPSVQEKQTIYQGMKQKNAKYLFYFSGGKYAFLKKDQITINDNNGTISISFTYQYYKKQQSCELILKQKQNIDNIFAQLPQHIWKSYLSDNNFYIGYQAINSSITKYPELFYKNLFYKNDRDMVIDTIILQASVTKKYITQKQSVLLIKDISIKFGSDRVDLPFSFEQLTQKMFSNVYVSVDQNNKVFLSDYANTEWVYDECAEKLNKIHKRYPVYKFNQDKFVCKTILSKLGSLKNFRQNIQNSYKQLQFMINYIFLSSFRKKKNILSSLKYAQLKKALQINPGDYCINDLIFNISGIKSFNGSNYMEYQFSKGFNTLIGNIFSLEGIFKYKDQLYVNDKKIHDYIISTEKYKEMRLKHPSESIAYNMTAVQYNPSDYFNDGLKFIFYPYTQDTQKIYSYFIYAVPSFLDCFNDSLKIYANFGQANNEITNFITNSQSFDLDMSVYIDDSEINGVQHMKKVGWHCGYTDTDYISWNGDERHGGPQIISVNLTKYISHILGKYFSSYNIKQPMYTYTQYNKIASDIIIHIDACWYIQSIVMSVNPYIQIYWKGIYKKIKIDKNQIFKNRKCCQNSWGYDIHVDFNNNCIRYDISSNIYPVITTQFKDTSIYAIYSDGNKIIYNPQNDENIKSNIEDTNDWITDITTSDDTFIDIINADSFAALCSGKIEKIKSYMEKNYSIYQIIDFVGSFIGYQTGKNKNYILYNSYSVLSQQFRCLKIEENNPEQCIYDYMFSLFSKQEILNFLTEEIKIKKKYGYGYDVSNESICRYFYKYHEHKIQYKDLKQILDDSGRYSARKYILKTPSKVYCYYTQVDNIQYLLKDIDSIEYYPDFPYQLAFQFNSVKTEAVSADKIYTLYDRKSAGYSVLVQRRSGYIRRHTIIYDINKFIKTGQYIQMITDNYSSIKKYLQDYIDRTFCINQNGKLEYLNHKSMNNFLTLNDLIIQPYKNYYMETYYYDFEQGKFKVTNTIQKQYDKHGFYFDYPDIDENENIIFNIMTNQLMISYVRNTPEFILADDSISGIYFNDDITLKSFSYKNTAGEIINMFSSVQLDKQITSVGYDYSIGILKQGIQGKQDILVSSVETAFTKNMIYTDIASAAIEKTESYNGTLQITYNFYFVMFKHKYKLPEKTLRVSNYYDFMNLSSYYDMNDQNCFSIYRKNSNRLPLISVLTDGSRQIFRLNSIFDNTKYKNIKWVISKQSKAVKLNENISSYNKKTYIQDVLVLQNNFIFNGTENDQTLFNIQLEDYSRILNTPGFENYILECKGLSNIYQHCFTLSAFQYLNKKQGYVPVAILDGLYRYKNITFSIAENTDTVMVFKQDEIPLSIPVTSFMDIQDIPVTINNKEYGYDTSFMDKEHIDSISAYILKGEK